MEFKTNIFEKNSKRVQRQVIYNVTILAAIAGVIALFIIGFIGILLTATLIITIVGIKIYDDKYMGINRAGDRKAIMVIAEDHLMIRDVKFMFSELSDLVIYVDEYAGKPKEFFGTHHGGNNEITFNHNGKNVSLNYIIKNKSDFHFVEKLVDGIEKNQKS